MRVKSWLALTAMTLVFPVTGCGNTGNANGTAGNTAGFVLNDRGLRDAVSPGRHGARGDIGAAAGDVTGPANGNAATSDAAFVARLPTVRVDAATKTLQIYTNDTAGTNPYRAGPRGGTDAAGTRNGFTALHITIPTGWAVNVHNPVNAAWKAALVPYPTGTWTGAGVPTAGARNIVPDARGAAGVAGVPGTPGVWGNRAGNGWAGRAGAGAAAGGVGGFGTDRGAAAGATTDGGARHTWPIPPGAGSTGLRGGAYGDRTDVTSSLRATKPGRYAIVSHYNGEILYVISVT